MLGKELILQDPEGGVNRLAESRKARADAVGQWVGVGIEFFVINIDAQDAQDYQDEKLLEEMLTRAIRDAGCPLLGQSGG